MHERRSSNMPFSFSHINQPSLDDTGQVSCWRVASRRSQCSVYALTLLEFLQAIQDESRHETVERQTIQGLSRGSMMHGSGRKNSLCRMPTLCIRGRGIGTAMLLSGLASCEHTNSQHKRDAWVSTLFHRRGCFRGQNHGADMPKSPSTVDVASRIATWPRIGQALRASLDNATPPPPPDPVPPPDQ
jgi:hypothetical protein